MNRQTGSLMIEYVVGLSFLLVGILGLTSMFFSTSRAVNATNEADEALVALEDLSEVLQAQPVKDVYTNYSGYQQDVPGLRGPDGGVAQLTVTCFVDETNIPAAFGPLQDLDGNPGDNSTNVSANYELLPVLLSVTYTSPTDTQTRRRFLVLGPSE